MKKKIVFSLMILALASTLVGGATLALFTDHVTADPAIFTTGTVEITGQDISITAIESEMYSPSPNPSIKTLTWCVENTGSKAAYIRVRAHGDGEQIEPQTAAVYGVSYGTPWWKMYFTYNLIEEIKKEELIAGQNYHAGWVTVYKDYENLYVLYETINGWALTDTHVYAETAVPNKDNANGAGQFRSIHNALDNTTSDLHIIPFQEIYSQEISSTIYLVTHAVVEKLPVEWTLNYESTSWIPGEEGWWYYESPVPPGEKVCITLDVINYDSQDEYYLEAQAVQASHNAIDLEWYGHPLQ